MENSNNEIDILINSIGSGYEDKFKNLKFKLSNTTTSSNIINENDTISYNDNDISCKERNIELENINLNEQNSILSNEPVNITPTVQQVNNITQINDKNNNGMPILNAATLLNRNQIINNNVNSENPSLIPPVISLQQPQPAALPNFQIPIFQQPPPPNVHPGLFSYPYANINIPALNPLIVQNTIVYNKLIRNPFFIEILNTHRELIYNTTIISLFNKDHSADGKGLDIEEIKKQKPEIGNNPGLLSLLHYSPEIEEDRFLYTLLCQKPELASNLIRSILYFQDPTLHNLPILTTFPNSEPMEIQNTINLSKDNLQQNDILERNNDNDEINDNRNSNNDNTKSDQSKTYIFNYLDDSSNNHNNDMTNENNKKTYVFEDPSDVEDESD
ncbi:hypothetical protein BCR36DRAFT_410393 [Piromyces finnis]|uniref:Uncharacterized protein n=1 Tax=Piromyces finnis TaxID=1754191 RepID=A0A1Y1VGC0_9FUNG|nr:hypothetical protein BCR36DRAFT_410393 [Piromyces finnis]|eukprot:ORX55474.1 hypothetical protein BCR36DRAFT_410393 [Piromyces finnis]